MMEVMKKMESSFKTSHARTGALTAPNPAAGHRRPMPLLKTPGFSLANLSQSLVGSQLLSPGSWCAQALFEPSEHLWRVWSLILNAISHLLPSCSSFSFALGHGVSPQSRTSALPAALAPTVLLGLLCTCTWGISPQRLQHCAASTPALRSTLSTFDFR